MTTSIWRYSHLVLAVSCFLFLLLASVSGIVLAVDAAQERSRAAAVPGFDSIRISETIQVLKQQYAEVSELSVDHNHQLLLKGIDNDGNEVETIVDPRSGKALGTAPKKSAFIEWITSLHRSLFLHETGRFFIGLTAFLLLLITLSGIMLVIQRQQGLRRFFYRVVKDHFAQYYHVVLGRLMLIPVLLIALTGAWLSMVRFHLLPEQKIAAYKSATPVPDDPGKAADPAAIVLFRATKLSEMHSLRFPFADDPEEYYELKLQDRELTIDQFSGKVLREVHYPFTELAARFSLDLHTGRTSILWAVVLAIACVNILFFIWSGFVITFRRTGNRSRNQFRPEVCSHIVLVGSENGSTYKFARSIYRQLTAEGHKAYLCDINRFRLFPAAEHFIVLTSTYGLGDAPGNADRLETLLEQYPQAQTVKVSVVGFGSRSYPDFCAFGEKADALFREQSWAEPLLPLYTVNDRQTEEFCLWVAAWSAKTGVSLIAAPAVYESRPSGLLAMTVVNKTGATGDEQLFTLTLRPRSRVTFTSGDLLAVYPAADHRERIYSIGKTGGDIQLVVKRHPQGFGSGYLAALQPGNIIKASVLTSPAFHMPAKAPAVIMIANGTGIAPFLGMIAQNTAHTECHFYGGFRTRVVFEALSGDTFRRQLELKRLHQFHIACSRDGEKMYVTDLVRRDAAFFATTLARGGVIMICGSLSMKNDVVAALEDICREHHHCTLETYIEQGQLLTDCY